MNSKLFFATFLSAIALIAVSNHTPVSGQILYEANFDDPNGSFEGWVDFQNRLASSVVTGGVWAGTGGSANDPQLRTAEGTVVVDLTGVSEASLQIRMRNSTGENIQGGASYVSFVGPSATNTAGNPVVNFTFTPSDPNTFELFNFDIKSFIDGQSGSDGIVRGIRLDPIGIPPFSGKTFEIDFIRIIEIDPGDANLDGAVDSLDFELISDNLFNTVAVGTNGDITDDGMVDYADFRFWRERLALQTLASAATIPEPSTAMLVALAMTFGFVRRSRANVGRAGLVLLAMVSIGVFLGGTEAQAQVIYEAGFNSDGDFEGWTSANVSGLTVSGGVLSGSVSSGNDPRLSLNPIPLIGGNSKIDSVVFRVKEGTPVDPNDFDPTGIVVSLSESNSTSQQLFVGNTSPELFSAVGSGSDFLTVTVDVSAYSGSDIDFFRFDPIGGPSAVGGSFEVDFVQIIRGPLFGDVDNDGDIDLIDKNILRDNLFETGLPRSQGDLNEDGIVDFDDFREWKNFYVPTATTVEVIPEPSTAAMIVSCFSILLTTVVLRPRRKLAKAAITLPLVGAVICASLTSSTQAIDAYWDQSFDNDYSVPSNWDAGVLPSSSFDEIAVIGTDDPLGALIGVSNVDSIIGTNPGGVILGQGVGTSGTLNINSGGNLIVENGPTTSGNMNVGGGGAGTGILNVFSGGQLTAEALLTSAASGNTITASGTAIIDIRDLNDPNNTANINFASTTRIVGPSVDISATGNLSFQGSSTYIPEITSSSHSPIKAAGVAVLGGTLQVEFNGHTPVAGESWDLVDAGSFTGAFTSVSLPPVSLGIGEQFVFNTVSDPNSTNGQVARLSLEQILVLEVNRSLNTVSISNPSGSSTVELDGYTISSPSGSIQSSSWNSLQDNGSFGGWEEAQNSNDSRLTEIKPVGNESLATSTTVSLGNIFNPQPTAFGFTGEDYEFEYTREDGTNITGVVQYTGPLPASSNTMILQVDPVTGEAILFNDSNLFDGSLEGYDILSESGSLLFSDGNWDSLDDQNAAGGDWRESNVSANRIAELKEAGDTLFTMNSGTVFNLGELFDISGTQDLELQFLQAGDSEPTKGIVIYETISVPGDFDGDGDVDGNDLTDPVLGWEARYGTDLNGLDFLAWQRNLGFGVELAPTIQAIPEPSTGVLCLAICVLGLSSRPRIKESQAA